MSEKIDMSFEIYSDSEKLLEQTGIIGEKIEIGQKTMRTKRGKTGKLATDYKWSKDMKDCFSKKGKK